MSDTENFDWCPTNGDVIVPEQRRIAVYVNNWGQAVIKEERSWDQEEDAFICISKEFLPDVIARLRAIVDANPQREDPEELKRQEAEEDAKKQQRANGRALSGGAELA
ncbi:hypothetical protein AAFG22_14715 [Bradyrhizobium sp. B024]|uniref:hypothetical protein n=1 Tax=Bradyrhizobium sp. B024 TaxID=3140247 RepID=UPI003182C896